MPVIVSVMRLYATPKPPRMTVLFMNLDGVQAKPRRGAKLFLSAG